MIAENLATISTPDPTDFVSRLRAVTLRSLAERQRSRGEGSFPVLLRSFPKCPQSPTTRQMALRCEGVMDSGDRREEAPRRGLGLEALHLPLTPPDHQVAAFDPVVVAETARPVDGLEAELSQSSAVGSQAVGRDRCGRKALISQQPA